MGCTKAYNLKDLVLRTPRALASEHAEPNTDGSCIPQHSKRLPAVEVVTLDPSAQCQHAEGGQITHHGAEMDWRTIPGSSALE